MVPGLVSNSAPLLSAITINYWHFPTKQNVEQPSSAYSSLPVITEQVNAGVGVGAVLGADVAGAST